VKNSAKIKLDEFSTPTNIKLALLWASLMFLYIWCLWDQNIAVHLSACERG